MRILLIGSLVAIGCGGNTVSTSSAEANNCSQIYSSAEQTIGANQSCATSDDCTYVITNCGLPSECGTVINKPGAVALRQTIDNWQSTNCSPAGSCKPCPSGPASVPCVNGVCMAPHP